MILTASTQAIPTGSILMWGTNTAPDGFVLCDGTAINRTVYSALFNIIGVNYGVGDGSATFNVPNFKQRFPMGKADSGTGSTLGDIGGAIDHTHTADPPNTTTSPPSATGPGLTVGITNNDAYLHTHDVDIASFNTGSNNPPFLTINYIIKI